MHNSKSDKIYNFALIQTATKGSLQTFAHAMTAVLSWHVQKFVALFMIKDIQSKLQETVMNMNCEWKIIGDMAFRSRLQISQAGRQRF